MLAQRYEAIDAALPNIRRVQDAFRAGGQEVIHVRIAFRTEDGREAGRAYMPSPHEQQYPRDERDDEILEEVAPQGDELVFSKTSSSVFNTTDVQRVLWNLGTRQSSSPASSPTAASSCRRATPPTAASGSRSSRTRVAPRRRRLMTTRSSA